MLLRGHHLPPGRKYLKSQYLYHVIPVDFLYIYISSGLKLHVLSNVHNHL